MPTYLFDMLLQGLVEAGNEEQARKILTTLADEDGYIYIDEYADIVLLKIPTSTRKDKEQCQNQEALSTDAD